MVDTRKMFEDAAQMIAAVARNPAPVAAGMGQWLDYCGQVAPECEFLWHRLRSLDFDEDANGLTEWLERLLSQNPPRENINGLWFGLHNPILEDGKPTCRMYVGGSSVFNPDSPSNEWVCQLSYFPEERYSKSQVLTELYRSVEPFTAGKVSYLGEPFLCHGYLALLVANWCKGPMRVKLLGGAPVRAVVIGHDSGDFYRIAVLTAR